MTQEIVQNQLVSRSIVSRTTPRILHFFPAIVVIVVMMAIMLFSQSAQAEVKVNLSVDYFDLTADSPDALLKAMKTANPDHQADVWARIDWNLINEVNFKSTAQGCKLRRLNGEVDVVITLPHWTNVEELPMEYQDWWKTLESYISTHEHSHKTHIVDAINDSIEEYAAIGEKASCAMVRNAYFAIKHKYEAQVKLKDQALDIQDGADVCLEALMMAEEHSDEQLQAHTESYSQRQTQPHKQIK